MTIELRPYQHEAVALVRGAMADGGKRVVLVLPTGAGKTRTGSAIVERAVAKGRRVMWLAHRTELIEQTAKTLHGFGLPVGVVAASSAWPIDASAPVQVCSIQTLLAREYRPHADLLIWDECHHASESAPAWATLLAAYPDHSFTRRLTSQSLRRVPVTLSVRPLIPHSRPHAAPLLPLRPMRRQTRMLGLVRRMQTASRWVLAPAGSVQALQLVARGLVGRRQGCAVRRSRCFRGDDSIRLLVTAGRQYQQPRPLERAPLGGLGAAGWRRKL